MKKSHKLYTALIFLFMYLPIFVLILYSFNDGKTTVWKGFTLDWYVDLFKDKLIMNALLNTMLIAVLASLIATILGTAAAIGINNFKGKKRVIIQNVSNISILTPDVVTGVALMLMFTIAGITFHFQMGFWTVLLAHISFCTPYVVLSVLPRLRRMDYSIYEAALDLGCNQFQAFYKVVLRMGKTPQALGFIYPNDGTHHKMSYYVLSVDEVESRTGIDFFYNLPDDIENEVESSSNLSRW